MMHPPSVIVAASILGVAYVLAHLHTSVASGGSGTTPGAVYIVNTITGKLEMACLGSHCETPR
jgi:hypothetical protein